MEGGCHPFTIRVLDSSTRQNQPIQKPDVIVTTCSLVKGWLYSGFIFIHVFVPDFMKDLPAKNRQYTTGSVFAYFCSAVGNL